MHHVEIATPHSVMPYGDRLRHFFTKRNDDDKPSITHVDRVAGTHVPAVSRLVALRDGCVAHAGPEH